MFDQLQRSGNPHRSDGTPSAQQHGREARLMAHQGLPLRASTQRDVQNVISGPGAPLDRDLAAFFGARFGHDLSHVRVHAGGGAARSARALDAAAYAAGHHIVFGADMYSPRSKPGLRLLTHELSHVPLRPATARVTEIAEEDSKQELGARAAEASLGRAGAVPVAQSGVLYRQPLSPTSASDAVGTTTAEHDRLKAAAATHRASDLEFGFTDIVAWKSDPGYLDLFKDNFVYANRDVITPAATMYDIPAELLAGVVRVEIGGKDPIKPLVYQWRNWVPGTADRDTTSLGQQAMQVRRAAESLDYNPASLTPAQHEAILESLKDPSQSIFLAAKHLSDLRDVDFGGTSGRDLTPDQIEVIGARYNQGPTRALAEVKKDLSYGRAITRRWALLGSLLTTAPKPLEYSPIENNIIQPANRAVYQLERNIYKLYGVPHF